MRSQGKGIDHSIEPSLRNFSLDFNSRSREQDLVRSKPLYLPLSVPKYSFSICEEPKLSNIERADDVVMRMHEPTNLEVNS
jgi:hypothetical protein